MSIKENQSYLIKKSEPETKVSVKCHVHQLDQNCDFQKGYELYVSQFVLKEVFDSN